MAADTYASLSDLRVPANLLLEIRELLAEKTDLRSLMVEIPFIGQGSLAVKSGAIQHVDAMSAPGEDTAASVTNFTDSSATLTVARYSLRREITDEAAMTGGPGLMDMAKWMADSAKYTLSSLLTGAFSGLSQSVGSTGVNLSLANWYSAIALMELNNVPGPFYAVLHPVQFTDLRNAIAAETAGLLVSQGNVNMLYAKDPGFKGEYLGVQTFTHISCPTANSGADRVGAMFGMGAFGFTEADPRPFLRSNPAVSFVEAGDGKLACEISRGDGTLAKTFLNGHYYPAVAELEDLRAVKIVTDA